MLMGSRQFEKWVKDRMQQTGDFAVAVHPTLRKTFQLYLSMEGGPFDGQSGWIFGNPLLLSPESENDDRVAVYEYDIDRGVMVFSKMLTKEQADAQYGLTNPDEEQL